MTRQRAIVRVISVVVVFCFLWSNVVYSIPSGFNNVSSVEINSCLSIDAKEELKTILPHAQVIATPLVFHSKFLSSGVDTLRELRENAGAIKELLITSGKISREDAEKYSFLIDSDPETGRKSYYYFNEEGWFFRVMEAEGIKDRFYEAFLNKRIEDVLGKTEPINGYFVEKYRISPRNVLAIHTTTAGLFGTYEGIDIEKVLGDKGTTINKGEEKSHLLPRYLHEPVKAALISAGGELSSWNEGNVDFKMAQIAYTDAGGNINVARGADNVEAVNVIAKVLSDVLTEKQGRPVSLLSSDVINILTAHERIEKDIVDRKLSFGILRKTIVDFLENVNEGWIRRSGLERIIDITDTEKGCGERRLVSILKAFIRNYPGYEARFNVNLLITDESLQEDVLRELYVHQVIEGEYFHQVIEGEYFRQPVRVLPEGTVDFVKDRVDLPDLFGFSVFVASLRDSIPLDFNKLDLFNLDETQIPGWPKYKDYFIKGKELLPETKVFLIMPALVDKLFSHSFRYGLHIVYSLAYLRQVAPAVREKVLTQLSEIGYGDIAKWVSKNYNLKLNDIMKSIKAYYPAYTDRQIRSLVSFIELRDRILGRSRSLRVGVETLIEHQGDEGYKEIMGLIASNQPILEILFGIRSAAIIDINLDDNQIALLREMFWALRQVEGQIVNILSLGGSRYYIYDEYTLRRLSPDKVRRYTVTREGLEHRIRLDIARGFGQYYDLPKELRGASRVEQELMENLYRAIVLAEPDQMFSKWDQSAHIHRAGPLAPRAFNLVPPKIDVNTTATMDREKALVEQMTAELEAESIFNNRIPQVVIDDSRPDIFAANAHNLAELSKRYGVKIIHLSTLNRTADQRQLALFLAEKYQKLLNEENLPDAIKNVLEKRGILKGKVIDPEKMVAYSTDNIFKHISGVRNYTVLIVHALLKMGLLDRANVIMSMDDDAPAETYVLKRRVDNPDFTEIKEYSRDTMRAERLGRRRRWIEKMLKDAGAILDRKIETEDEFYSLFSDDADDANYNRLKGLLEKYFVYSPDGKAGFIPMAMGQISKLSDRYIEPKNREVTHQRYQSLQVPLPPYLVTMSDFVYPRPRTEKRHDIFMVMPVNIFAVAGLVGKKVGDTILPIMYGDLRGTMAYPIMDQHYSLGSPDVSHKTITYIAFPFIEDQDTSGLAQLLRYLDQEDMRWFNLQHTDQSALILEGVGGFIADTYVIFNRAVLDNTNPSPSIGRDLRLEEPPYIKWVRSPAAYGSLAVAYSTVAGAQQREIGERTYIIAKQDYDEQVGGFARAFYEQAVRDFYAQIMDAGHKPLSPGKTTEELYKILAEKFINSASKFSLGQARAYAIKIREFRAFLLAELGRQIKEKEKQLNELKAKKKQDLTEEDSSQMASLQEQINDMSLILVQFAHFFSLYHAQEGAVAKSDFSKIVDDTDALFKDLIKNGYINEEGVIRDVFGKLKDPSEMVLGPAYQIERQKIYDILRQRYEKGKDNYSPKTDADYFYHVRRDGDLIRWQAVIPRLEVGDRRGIKVCLESDWEVVKGKQGVVDISSWSPGLSIKMEDGRGIIFNSPLKDGEEAIAPAVVDAFTEEYIRGIENNARDQIASDGELIMFWVDVVEKIMDWSNSGIPMVSQGDAYTESVTLMVGNDFNHYINELRGILDGRDPNKLSDDEVNQLSDDVVDRIEAIIKKPWISQESRDAIRDIGSKVGANAKIIITLREKAEKEIKEGYERIVRKARQAKILFINELQPDANISKGKHEIGIRFNSAEKRRISITPVWKMAGWTLRYAQLAKGVKLGLDQASGKNYIKVITGRLSNIDCGVFANPRQKRSTLVKEDWIQAGEEGAIVAIMVKTDGAPESVKRIEDLTITGNESESLSWESCEQYNWGPEFVGLPFYNLHGFQIKNGKGEDVCFVKFWAAGKGVNCGMHAHGDKDAKNTFGEVHVTLFNGTGQGGMVYTERGQEKSITLGEGEEHGPIWELNSVTGKPIRRDNGGIVYSLHRWQSGGQRVSAGEEESFDVWAAYEIASEKARIDAKIEIKDADLSHAYALILAGGGGTRAWPWSTDALPKQLLRLFGTELSLVQESVKRALNKLAPERIYIQTIPQLRAQMIEAVKQFGVPAENVLCEPAITDTAAAIGYGTVEIYRKDKDATIITLTADHKIMPADKFWAALESTVRAAQNGPNIVCLGIVPTRPHTGFGYQEVGDKTNVSGINVLNAFKEKPDEKTAKQYVESGRYLWNSGMFVFMAETMLKCFMDLAPEYYAGLKRMIDANDADRDTVAQEVFSEFAIFKKQGSPSGKIKKGRTSIDYVVMEPLSQGQSPRAEILTYFDPQNIYFWEDVGDLGPGLRRANEELIDGQGNLIFNHANTEIKLSNVSNTNVLVQEGSTVRKVVIEGLDNCVVAIGSHSNAVVVMPVEQSQKVKDLQAQLSARIEAVPYVKGMVDSKSAKGITHTISSENVTLQSDNGLVATIGMKDTDVRWEGDTIYIYGSSVPTTASRYRMSKQRFSRSTFGEQLVFGTSGIREIVKYLEDIKCYAIAKAIASYFKGMNEPDIIALAADLRPSSPRIMQDIIIGNLAMGRQVVYTGNIPTPAVVNYGMYRQTGAIPSAMVTASHCPVLPVPKEQNGIKPNRTTGEVLKQDERLILKQVREFLEIEFMMSQEESMFDAEGKRKGQDLSDTQRSLVERALQLMAEINDEARRMYISRYVDAFGNIFDEGDEIDFIEHMAVGRSMITDIFTQMGAKFNAQIRQVEWQEGFIVDTEDLQPKLVKAVNDIVDANTQKHKLIKGIFTTDGDSDRPALFHEDGTFVYGDKLGYLTCEYIRNQKANKDKKMFVAVTATVSDAVVRRLQHIGFEVAKVKIGSPYVVKAMEDRMTRAREAGEEVVCMGFERNGGFLLGTDITLDSGRILKALPTRDAVLPIIAAFHTAKKENKTIGEVFTGRFSGEFASYGWSGLIEAGMGGNCDLYTATMGQAIMRSFSPRNLDIVEVQFRADSGVTYLMRNGDVCEAAPGDDFALYMNRIKSIMERHFDSGKGFPGGIAKINYLDGVRMFFKNLEVVHMRPSGNAPQWRIYSEAATLDRAKEITGYRIPVYPNIIGEYLENKKQFEGVHIIPRSNDEMKKTFEGIFDQREDDWITWEMVFGSNSEHSVKEGIVFGKNNSSVSFYRTTVYDIDRDESLKWLPRSGYKARQLTKSNSITWNRGKGTLTCEESWSDGRKVSVVFEGPDAWLEIGRGLDKNIPMGKFQDMPFPVMSDKARDYFKAKGIYWFDLFDVSVESEFTVEAPMWQHNFNFKAEKAGMPVESEAGPIAKRVREDYSINVRLVKIITEDQKPLDAARSLFNTIDSKRLPSTIIELSNILRALLLTDNAVIPYVQQFYSAVISESLGLTDSESTRKLQIIAGQALNIIFWIKNRVSGAEGIELTLNESEMLQHPDKGKYPIGSFLNASTMPVSITDEEFTSGVFWRGHEGVSKLGAGSIREDFAYDNDRLNSMKGSEVMYIMDHGFVEVPDALKGNIGKSEGRVSTIHETVFVNDLLPGSLQTTSTGPGHYQGTNLDVKYITEGKGIQLNILYDSEGNIVEVLAQSLEPGAWTMALPGYVDAMINLGGLRFNDFSINLSEEQARGFVSEKYRGQFNFHQKVVPTSPYLAILTSGINEKGKVVANKPYLVKAIANAPEITWVQGPSKDIFGGEDVNLLNLYTILNMDRVNEIVNRLVGSQKPTSSRILIVDGDKVRERATQIASFKGRAFKVDPYENYQTWAGRANKEISGRGPNTIGENVSELWYGSNQTDGLAVIPGTIVTEDKDVVMTELSLKELTQCYPEMLGAHTAKPLFIKFLCTRFAGKVHMGFNAKIKEIGQDKFIGLLKLERRLTWQLKDMIKEGKDEDEVRQIFNNFKEKYELWATAQADTGWTDAVKLDGTGWLKEGVTGQQLDDLMEKIRVNRNEIVSVFNEITLEPGQNILSPVGYPHAIFGLSHQTHPLKGSEAKNEGWIIIPVIDEVTGLPKVDEKGRPYIIQVEPQQTSNTTYSFADFYTPIDIDKKTKRLDMRKNLARDPKLTGEARLLQELETIENYVRNGLFAEETTTADFMLNARTIKESEDGSAVEEALIEGTNKVWHEEYFVAHRVRFNKAGSINMAAEDNVSQDLLVTSGTVTITGLSAEPITIKVSESIFIPADSAKTYTITANGPAEILRFYKRPEKLRVLSKGQEPIWEVLLSENGQIEEGKSGFINPEHEKANKVDEPMLNRVLARFIEKNGLGVFTMVKGIVVTDNLREEVEVDGVAPYVSVKEGKVYIDIDGFDNEELLYVEMDHALKHFILLVVEPQDQALREVTNVYLTLKEALGSDIEIPGDIEKIGVEFVFLKQVKKLKDLRERGSLTDDKIISSAIEVLSQLPYYKPLFSRLGLDELMWRNAVVETEGRLEAAMTVYNRIAEAVRGEEGKVELAKKVKVTEEKVLARRAAPILEQLREEVEGLSNLLSFITGLQGEDGFLMIDSAWGSVSARRFDGEIKESSDLSEEKQYEGLFRLLRDKGIKSIGIDSRFAERMRQGQCISRFLEIVNKALGVIGGTDFIGYAFANGLTVRVNDESGGKRITIVDNMKSSIGENLLDYLLGNRIDITNIAKRIAEIAKRTEGTKIIKVDVDHITETIVNEIKVLASYQNAKGEPLFRFYFYSSSKAQGAVKIPKGLEQVSINDEDVEKITGNDVITLLDPIYMRGVLDNESARASYYLPVPYIKGAVYIAAEVLLNQGKISAMDWITASWIKEYFGVLLREADIEVNDTLAEQIFTGHWSDILPAIEKVLKDIDSIGRAMAITESMA